MTTTSVKATLLHTPLYGIHLDLGAKMSEFAGFDMPIQYGGLGSIAAEHTATRTGTALFDVSHMGRAYLTGSNSRDLLQFLLTNDVDLLKPGDAQYSFLVKQGEARQPLTLDDVYLYQLAPEEYLLIVNAANAQADFGYIAPYASEMGVKFTDLTSDIALIAVQGPKSRQTLEQVLSGMKDESANRHFPAHFGATEVLVTTTGYTGEFTRHELLISAGKAPDVWTAMIEAGAVPAGLGARNTLRIEGGLLLYGHDINQDVSPVQAGMGFAVKPAKQAAMIGKQFFEEQKAAAAARTLGRYFVQLEILSPQPRQVEGRHGMPSTILFRGEPVGEITSATVAPMVRYDSSDGFTTVPRGLALGYSSVRLKGWPEEDYAKVEIRVRGAGEPVPAMVMNQLVDKKIPLEIGGREHVRPVSYAHR